MSDHLNNPFDFNNPFDLNAVGNSPLDAPPPPLELRRDIERWPYIYRQYEFHQIDQVDQHGRTPLFYARSREAIQHFIERGSNVFHRDNDDKTFLHFLFSSDEGDIQRDILYGLFDMAVTCLRRHINRNQLWELIDSVDNQGNTILHYATMYKQLEKEEYGVLVSYIDLSVKNNEGLEAIDIARQDALVGFDISLVYVILIVQENDRRSRRDYRRHFAEVGKSAAEISKTIYGNLPDDVFNHVMKFLRGKKVKRVLSNKKKKKRVNK